jgi:hypothetical protein
MQFDAVLRMFGDFFERERIRWALAGGLAVAAWGYQRNTHDIDFVISGADREKVVAFAESAGYETIHSSEAFSHHVHSTEDFGRVDALYVYGQTALEMFASATKRIAAGKVSVPVISPEHIAMMKAFAIKANPTRRKGDARDVEFLLTIPGINREAIRNYFARFGLLEFFDDIDAGNIGQL